MIELWKKIAHICDQFKPDIQLPNTIFKVLQEKTFLTIIADHTVCTYRYIQKKKCGFFPHLPDPPLCGITFWGKKSVDIGPKAPPQP